MLCNIPLTGYNVGRFKGQESHGGLGATEALHYNFSLPHNRPELGEQIVGNLGLYCISYRPFRLEWNVMPTAKDAKGMETKGACTDD